MVKKTRKEKQAADLRKKNRLSQPHFLPDQPAPPVSSNIWIKKDLVKSFGLALIVLGFQLVLYWRLGQ